MFLVDNVAGIEKLHPRAKFVRYAKNMELLITIQNTKNGHIYTPYLKLDYDFVSEMQLEDEKAVVPVSFTIRYVGSEEIANRHDNGQLPKQLHII